VQRDVKQMPEFKIGKAALLMMDMQAIVVERYTHEESTGVS
jgi:hypothetical protein